jgi:hypothetical protein
LHQYLYYSSIFYSSLSHPPFFKCLSQNGISSLPMTRLVSKYIKRRMPTIILVVDLIISW